MKPSWFPTQLFGLKVLHIGRLSFSIFEKAPRHSSYVGLDKIFLKETTSHKRATYYDVLEEPNL